MTSKPIKLVNVANDLLQQQATFTHEECPHCDPTPTTRTAARPEPACRPRPIAESVRILKEHERSESGGLPVGQARGKVILPCGTGKTRISLRIVEELTPPGGLSIVLCPSIALVAQIRREYLQHAETAIRALAVCSDETAGLRPQEGRRWQRPGRPDPGQEQRQRLRSEGQGHHRRSGNRRLDTARPGQAAGQRHLRHLPEQPPGWRSPAHRRERRCRAGGRRGAPYRRTAPQQENCKNVSATSPSAMTMTASRSSTASTRPPRRACTTPAGIPDPETRIGWSATWMTKPCSGWNCIARATWKPSPTAGLPITASLRSGSTTPMRLRLPMRWQARRRKQG